jgi:5-methylcytosine-specific restriction endonuclease McrA
MDRKTLLPENTSGDRTCFKKGHIGYKGFLGKKHTPETKEKMRQIALEQKRSISFKGRKHSEESRLKMSLKQKGKHSACKGRPSPLRGRTLSEETKEKIRQAHLGMKHTEETKEKVRQYNLGKKRPLCTGETHPFWKGGVTPIYKKIRKSPQYITWRTDVFERDNYTCIHCGQKGGVLNADHIKPFSQYPELRFDLNNGRTLCKPCHRKTDTWGGNSKKKIICTSQ